VGPIRIALVGMGKIAHDQHVPAIASNDSFILTATASRNGHGVPGVAHAESLEALLEHGPPIDAVALCTPPRVRYPLAALALERGLHVFLEKPPGATVSEVDALQAAARRHDRTLFASWHSRFAPGVEPARTWLAERHVEWASVVWHEDVHVWHPGQSWIWEPGGFGVFDPGINALSILTHILPQPFYVTKAKLGFPENRAAPVAAKVAFRDAAGATIATDLDFREAGPPIWDIVVKTDAGTAKLSAGGAALSLPSGMTQFEEQEYPALYRRFEGLIRVGAIEVDVRPLQLVADVFLSGSRETVDPLYD